MIFSDGEAYQHALCMELRQDKLLYAFVNRASKEIKEVGEESLASFDRRHVEEIITTARFKQDFGAISLSAGLPRNTLVPGEIFTSSTPLDIFKLNYSEPIEDIDFNRLPELGIVNIYELPTWIKSAFIFKFPKIRIIHPSTVVIKGIFDQPNFHPRAHIYIDENVFYLLITENNKLQYYNRFEYKELADIIYHLLFVMEQKEYPQETTNLSLYGVSDKWPALGDFQKYFKKEVKVSPKRESAQDFLLAKQILCV